MTDQRPPAPPPAKPRTLSHHSTSLVRHRGTVFEQSRKEFYEARWPEPDLSAGSLRNWLVRKQRFFLRRLPRTGRARVLDLGCGGGWRLFTLAGPTLGVDISHGSLLGARGLYHGVAVADLAGMPFRDASFELVVSSDVLGHIPLDAKQHVIQEIHRVLKPGGRTLHYIEAEGDDPLTQYAKQDPALYQRRIIGPEGHEGIEAPAATFARFRQAGFQPVVEAPAYRLLMYVGRAVQLFDNEYARRSRAVGALVALCKLLTTWHPLELAANLVVALLIELTDRILPESWGSGVMVEYVKTA